MSPSADQIQYITWIVRTWLHLHARDACILCYWDQQRGSEMRGVELGIHTYFCMQIEKCWNIKLTVWTEADLDWKGGGEGLEIKGARGNKLSEKIKGDLDSGESCWCPVNWVQEVAAGPFTLTNCMQFGSQSKNKISSPAHLHMGKLFGLHGQKLFERRKHLDVQTPCACC